MNLLQRISQLFRGAPSGSADHWYWPVGTDTEAGQPVTPETAMRLSAVYACVRVVSETIASLPLHLYSRTSDRVTELAVDNPLYPIIHSAPNSLQTTNELVEWIVSCLELRGNAYCWIARGSDGTAQALYPMNPDLITPQPDGTYHMRRTNGQVLTFANNEILHVRQFAFDGVNGQSTIKTCADVIGLALAADVYASKFFKNGGRPGGVLEHPGQLRDEARQHLRESWTQLHTGSDNAHRVAILEEGMKFVPITVPPAEVQLLEARRASVQEIARMFRVQPHKIMELSQATYSNIEHQSIEWVTDSLQPRLVRIESAMNRALLAGSDGGLFVKFNVSSLLRGDVKARYEAYASAIQQGWMSRNEVRDLEDLNPFDGGDEYLVPLNMGLAAEIEQGEEEPTQPPARLAPPEESREAPTNRAKIRERYTPMLRRAISKSLTRQAAEVRKGAEKRLGSRSAEDFQVWLENYYAGARGWVRDIVDAVVTEYSDAIAEQASAEIGADKPPMDYGEIVDIYTKQHTGMSLYELRDIEDLDELEEALEQWGERADNEAQEQSVLLEAVAALGAWKLLGVKKIRWAISAGACPMCAAIDGKVVGIESQFSPSNGDFRHPPIHKGCSCHIEAEV